MKVLNYVSLSKTIVLDEMEVSVTDNGFYYIFINKDIDISVEKVKLIVNTMALVGNSAKMPVLIEIDDYSLPTKEAREYVALKNSSPNALAEAYVVKTMAQKLVGNFYLNFNKPQRPTRVFTDMKEAIKWLEQYK